MPVTETICQVSGNRYWLTPWLYGNSSTYIESHSITTCSAGIATTQPIPRRRRSGNTSGHSARYGRPKTTLNSPRIPTAPAHGMAGLKTVIVCTIHRNSRATPTVP